jgi:hypothetical protein
VGFVLTGHKLTYFAVSRQRKNYGSVKLFSLDYRWVAQGLGKTQDFPKLDCGTTAKMPWIVVQNGIAHNIWAGRAGVLQFSP